MEVNLTIRNYQPCDHDALAQIYLQSRIRTFYWLDTTPYALADFNADTLGETLIVALVGHEPVGFLSIWEPDNFIHHLYVHPQHVGKGIGKALLNKAALLFDAPLKLKCLKQNEHALAFYQSQGWAAFGGGEDINGAYLELTNKLSVS
ncbi:GNAT family N-acetyltransferase [Mucilaginibacter psychrotolerans]|uniref:GNAT family N-acetyltransferase n=1 Tax=Mucilaginibacter psychrotolerans TaxID=1524096 RepID=A0A4Y8SQH4_9SPHI|nr:GNAT family N-acetyltransferase [Mucilaginibacter psychrotolerans]TFF40895.1 GNAT family N-acetyltransferase [Mucilaginibacter psychrotolerans]